MTFRTVMVPSSFILLELLNFEDKGNTILWNVKKCSPTDTKSLPWRLQILSEVFHFTRLCSSWYKYVHVSAN